VLRLSLTTAVIALCAATTGCGEPNVGKHPRPFQSELWKSAGGGDVRCDMVADLRERIGLVGKTKAQLIELLGPPSDDGQGGTHYHLCPSFTDIWILEIRWKDGRVASTTVRDT
jgi:hypothetical protein